MVGAGEGAVAAAVVGRGCRREGVVAVAVAAGVGVGTCSCSSLFENVFL